MANASIKHSARAGSTSIIVLTALLLTPLSGCFGPRALYRSMIQYDKYYQQSEVDLLLLNIARLRQNEPPHFMMLSSINNSVTFGATLSSQFGWTANPPKGNTYQAGPFSATSTEAPLFSIIPIQGQDFANRLYSPLTSHLSYFLLRDQYPETLLLLMGQYLYVIDGNNTKKEECYKDTSKEKFVGLCSYNNDSSLPAQQDKFWFLVSQLESLKENGGLRMEKLGADLDAYEPPEEASSLPTATELELAAKDNFRWAREAYQLIDRRPGQQDKVLASSWNAPTADQIAYAARKGYKWVPLATTEKTYELIDERSGHIRRALAVSAAVPTAKDIEAAAKDGFRWIAKGQETKQKYQLIRSAQYADKIFALFDFDMNGPFEAPLSLAKIRRDVEPDPQDFIYVELRHTQPKIKGYIKTRDFVEILQFLAKSANVPADSRFPNGKSRRFVAGGQELPKFGVEASVSYEDYYLWIPSSEATDRRDRQAFLWLYTLYQMSMVDASKLPQIPVTIAK